MEGGGPAVMTMSFCVPLNQVVLYKVPPWKEVLHGRVALSPSLTVTFDWTPSITARGNDEWMINEKWEQGLAYRDPGIYCFQEFSLTIALVHNALEKIQLSIFIHLFIQSVSHSVILFY